MKRATKENRCNNANTKKNRLYGKDFHKIENFTLSDSSDFRARWKKKRRRRRGKWVKETTELQNPAQFPLSLTGGNKERWMKKKRKETLT